MSSFAAVNSNFESRLRLQLRAALFVVAASVTCNALAIGIGGIFTSTSSPGSGGPFPPNKSCFETSWWKSGPCPDIYVVQHSDCSQTKTCFTTDIENCSCSEIFAYHVKPGSVGNYNAASNPIFELDAAYNGPTIAVSSGIKVSSFHVFSLTTGLQVSTAPGVNAGGTSNFTAASFALDEPYAIFGKTLDGRFSGFTAFRRESSPARIDPVPIQVLWTDGSGGAKIFELVAFLDRTNGRVISQAANFATSSQTMTHNAYACAGDFNSDSMVDDMDFVEFVSAYNTLICDNPANCPADLTGDANVDDADFSIFVVAYDAFVCP